MPTSSQWTVLDRFNSATWQVLARAAREASDLGAAELETPHLLIALADTDEAALGQALRRNGLSSARLRDALKRLRGITLGAADEPLPLSRRSKLALELAMRQAATRQASAPVPDDLLIGVLAQEHSTAVEMLRDVGVDTRALHDEVQRTHPLGA